MIVVFALLGVPLLLCAGVLTWYVGRQSIAADKLHARMEDLSQRGEPVDNVSLELTFQVATSDADTQQWVALRETLDTDEFRQTVFDLPFHGATDENNELIVVPRPGEPWPQRQETDDFLKLSGKHLDTIRSLGEAQFVNTGKPLRRPIEFRSVATLLPDTQFVRAMARLMQLEHAVAVYDGDNQRALECIRAVAGMERSIYGEPLMISQLIGQAIGFISGGMIQRSVEHGQLTNEQMDELADALPSFQQLCDLYEMGILGERAMLLPLFSNPREAEEMMELESAVGANLLTKTRPLDALYYLEAMDRLLELPRDDMLTFRRAADQVDDQFESDIRNSGVIQKFDRVMSYMLMPAVGSFAGVMVRRAEHNHLIKLAVAVRKFHRQFDRWPKTLDELNVMGVDPTQLQSRDAPFGYQIEGDQAVIWGINRSAASMIPPQPPEVRDEDAPHAAWVWRLRP